MDNKKKALIGSIGAIIIVAVLLGVLFASGNKSVSDNSAVRFQTDRVRITG